MANIPDFMAMRTGEKDETIPMLVGDDNHDQRLSRPERLNAFWSFHKTWSFIHVALIATYSMAFSWLWYKIHEREATSLTQLPDIRINYGPKLYADFEQSVYAGLPSPKLDRAWHELLEDITIRVSEVELEQSNQTSVALPGGGYMAWLGVSHELHCIKMLRQWNYRDHYHPNTTEKEAIHWDVHADHCLELLRSAALCHGDTTLTTFRWDQKEKPMLNTKLIPHKCVNWENLQSSIRHRAVHHAEIASMVNPLLKPK